MILFVADIHQNVIFKRIVLATCGDVSEMSNSYARQFSWWVLQHCTGFAQLVWGRLRVHRAFVYSDWFVCFMSNSYAHQHWCCSVLQCVAVCCSVLQCVAACCSVLQCVAVCCSVLQCVAVCCNVLQCVVVCCSVFALLAHCWFDSYAHQHWRRTSRCPWGGKRSRNSTAWLLAHCWSTYAPALGQCVAVYCSVLQCIAVCCSVLQCVAVCLHY